ncbi:MAG: YqaJ viral recombinase family protein [Patescibacteria group bacterium]|nr:YqaJ viral recombinase family protein [Patescibacteria group bacterium]MDE2227366.1 YqaJ viral recombinase family protein [Patescibacteria group bacterium]
MKTTRFENSEDWLAARAGKITGTRLKDIVVKRGTGKKIGFYELIAERLFSPPDGEDPMERGTRLQDEALDAFCAETGKKVKRELAFWQREENENIAISPDAAIGKTEAVEVKCLSSARHLEAYLTQQVPDDYKYQTLQYFIVNDKLKTLHVVFYDPRVSVKPYFRLRIDEKDIREESTELLAYERETLREVDEIVKKLSGF